jgi:hypothetical protein
MAADGINEAEPTLLPPPLRATNTGKRRPPSTISLRRTIAAPLLLAGLVVVAGVVVVMGAAVWAAAAMA